MSTIALDKQYMANNYASIPIAIARGNGVYIWDVEGNKYIDFQSGYSAVNQGHCHPKILEAFVEQAKTLTMCS